MEACELFLGSLGSKSDGNLDTKKRSMADFVVFLLSKS